MRTRFLVLVLLTAPIGHAQLQPVSATPNAPVAITGDVGCSERFASGEVKFTNTSSLGIVALESVIKVKCSGGPSQAITGSFDRLFFQADGLPIGATISAFLPEEQDFWSNPNVAPTNVDQTVSRVDVEIRMVQFEDGSTWGDSRMINRLRIRRKSIESILGRLASASDDQEFDSMLDRVLSAQTEDPHASSMAYKISLLRKEAGTSAARAGVVERLRVAAERDASGKF